MSVRASAVLLLPGRESWIEIGQTGLVQQAETLPTYRKEFRTLCSEPRIDVDSQVCTSMHRGWCDYRLPARVSLFPTVVNVIQCFRSIRHG